MKRNKHDSIKAHVARKEFTILVGARQVGKSTLLKQIAEELRLEGETAVFLNLERKNILDELDQNPENVFRYIPSEGKRAFVFIDEIQYLKDPSNFLKLLYDEHADKLKIVATGSSAFYIDRNFKDSLAGRKKIFELQTLDFDEFLHFKGRDDLKNELVFMKKNPSYVSVYSDVLDVLFEEYLIFGGYPAVVLETSTKDKIDKLEEIKYAYIKRDISDSGVQDETRFYRLMILMASQVGNLVNVNELAKTLSMAVATVDNYLYIMQKCFHVKLVKPFYQNLRKELVKMPKVYFYDLGLRHSFLNNFNSLDLRPDKGQIVENYVFRRLIQDNQPDQVKFWRTADGNEVDFVVETELGKGFALEVKYAEQEFKDSKYKKFQEAYPEFPLKWIGMVSKELKNNLIRF